MLKNFFFIIITFLFVQDIEGQHKKREMRAVWIATVANIDWPTSSLSPGFIQRNELIRMLDGLAANNINAIVFQARPSADAFYQSSLEPWSAYLTGVQGKMPEPFYDPLHFLIEEARKRFMEVHLWLNPYRVLNSSNIKKLSPNHIYFRDKNLIVNYGGKLFFDPGLDETRKHLNQVVKDIVERYDIDAIHFDDYFYPYPVGKSDFPDQETFRKFPRGFNNKADWRRNNVDLIISELQQTIKSIKPWVEFGISPFGVWRNESNDSRGSATRAGIQNYDDLYADILKWLRKGWIDYVVPQLYWEIGKTVADYAVLIDWWSKNSYNRNLYIGLFASGLELNQTTAWKSPNELTRQLQLNKHYPQISGAMFFSAKPFLKNLQGLNDSLKMNFYRYRAICPENSNIAGRDAIQPANLRFIQNLNHSLLTWDMIKAEGGDKVQYYVVYAFSGRRIGDLNNPENIWAFTTSNLICLNNFNLSGYYTFVVTSINKFRRESKPMFGITRKF